MPNLLWLQAGSCSGDTMSLLCAETPNIMEALATYSIDLLWHPSLFVGAPDAFQKLVSNIESGELRLDILCIEGAVMTGPDGSGMYDSVHGRAKADIARTLTGRAAVVIAVGSCACFGGVPAAAPNPADATGVQWFKGEPGGLLPPEWRSRAGFPVINLAGCPANATVILQTLIAIIAKAPLPLDHLNRPESFYGPLVHQGCTRNERHEYDDEDHQFGGPGCLFFNLGCQGPNASASCNTVLWNGVSSKTRAGVPCFGCTSPFFPREKDLFRTDKIVEIPVELPLGVRRAYYMAYKGLAAAAKPKRLTTKLK